MATLQEAKENLLRTAEKVIPDPDCKKCMFLPYHTQPKPNPKVWITDYSKCGYTKPCGACSRRKPHEWVAVLDPQTVIDFFEARGVTAVLIEELKVLLPKKRGFEFL